MVKLNTTRAFNKVLGFLECNFCLCMYICIVCLQYIAVCCYHIIVCASHKLCRTETQFHFLVSDVFRMKKLQQKVTSSLILNFQRHSNARLWMWSVVLCHYIVLIWQQNGQAAPFIQVPVAIFTGRRCRKCSRQCWCMLIDCKFASFFRKLV